MAEEYKVYIPLEPNNVNLVRYEANKRWVADEGTISSISASVGRALSAYDLPYRKALLPVSSSCDLSAEPVNSNGQFQRNTFYFLRQELNKSRAYIQQVPYLATTASYLEISKDIFGEGIKRNSFCVTDCSNAFAITMRDDGLGRLIDTGIPTESFKSNIKKQTAYYPVEQITQSFSTPFTGELIDCGRGLTEVLTVYTSSIVQGVPSTGSLSYANGKALYFNGSSSYGEILTTIAAQKYRKEHEYGISFWACLPPSQSTACEEVTLISKRARREPNYSFAIELGDSLFFNRVAMCVSDGSCVVTVRSAALTPGWHHIYAAKSGSNSTLFVDGQFEASASLAALGNFNNVSKITVGTDITGSGGKFFSGSISDIRFFSQSLSDTDIGYLANRHYISGSYKQTNIMGTVNYSTGLVIASDSNAKYHNLFMGDGAYNYTSAGFNLEFRNRVGIRNLKVDVPIASVDLNSSFNPSFILSSEVTSSIFKPYITSVGLYDRDYNLVGVAKLSRPIIKSNLYNTNITVNLDVSNG